MELPAILEMEDSPAINRPRIASMIESPHTSTSLSGVFIPSSETKPPELEVHADIHDKNEARMSEESDDTPRLGPKLPTPHIDNLTHFWSTYDKVSGEFDKELLDGWNKSLDVLLIFAGLFSAINTAFIIDSYKGLQPDPVEETNALLRLLILHRNDNDTLSIQDLSLVSPSSAAVPINSIFFTSLSFSLTAAFGAVTAKQWLTEYSNIGVMKAVHIHGRMRQERYKSLRNWHLRFIIELLPLFLQISLLLFLVGVVDLLWSMNKGVAILQLALSISGVILYTIAIVIGIAIPTSPFQTPFARYIRHFLYKTYRGRRNRKRGLSGPCHATASARTALLIKAMTEWSKNVSWAIVIGRISSLGRRYSPSSDRGAAFDTDTRVGNEGKRPELHTGWSHADVTAAESVVWLLERAEHPDVTIAALDAVPRLPPDLVFSLIKQREGLWERLVVFHNSLLPLSEAGGLDEWARAWPNSATVSGISLHHILLGRALDRSDKDNGSTVDFANIRNLKTRDTSRQEMSHPDVLAVTNLVLNWITQPMKALGDGISYNFLQYISFIMHPSLAIKNPHPFQVELADISRAMPGAHFTTSVCPISLILDAIICSSLTRRRGDHFSEEIRELVLPFLCTVLRDESSYDIVSHVALTVATIYATGYSEDPPNHIAAHRLEDIHGWIRKASSDKSSMILENVAWALSMINDGSRDATIFIILLRITEPLFQEKKGELDWQSIPFRSFPRNLLLLSGLSQRDHDSQLGIVRLLNAHPTQALVSHLDESSRSAITQLLKSLFTSPIQSGKVWEQGALLLNQVASQLIPSSEFVDITFNLELWKSFTRRCIQENRMDMQQIDLQNFTSIMGVLQMPISGSPGRSVLIVIQTLLATALLVQQATRGWVTDDVVSFLNVLIDEDTELQWPEYLVSAGFIRSNVYQTTTSQTARAIAIDRVQLNNYLKRDHSTCYVWFGEAFLLLWKKGRKEYLRTGRGLECDYIDDIFYESSVVQKIVMYWREIDKVKNQVPDRFKPRENTTETVTAYLAGARGALNCSRNDDQICEEAQREQLHSEVDQILQELELLKKIDA
ncbi:hypothetical protein FRC03_008721 [Tulasnella sp. 419]|nr:hypothetical protein FRC03_008721 [Tulasnella sp. 419]